MPSEVNPTKFSGTYSQNSYRISALRPNPIQFPGVNAAMPNGQALHPMVWKQSLRTVNVPSSQGCKAAASMLIGLGFLNLTICNLFFVSVLFDMQVLPPLH